EEKGASPGVLANKLPNKNWSLTPWLFVGHCRVHIGCWFSTFHRMHFTQLTILAYQSLVFAIFFQLSAQSDVVLRVIQRICEKGKKNVLAFGYANVTETSSMSVRFAPNLCSYQPNPTTVTIKNSILWKTLLSRIGDDVMMYLLEHCSLFMLVKPSCCYQLCGVPIYSLITAGTRLPALWLRRRPIRARFNILLKIVQKRIRFHKGFLLKRKRRTLVDRDSCLDARGTTECNKQKWTQIVSVHTRKPAKRAKLDTDIRGTKRAASNEGDDNDHFNPGRSAKHGQSTKCIAKNDYSWDGLNPDGQCRAAVGVSGQAKPSPIPADASDAATVKNVRTWGSVYVERGHIIYCNDNRECLPKSFLLNCLQGCSSGGQRLVEAIFLSSDAFGNNGKKQPNNYWRKRRLPKRYWKMKNVFFRLLRNHKRCPYRLLLNRNCTGSLQPSEIPNLRCQHKRPTGIPAGKQKVNKELKVFADFDQTGMASGSDGDLLQLLKHYSSPLQVYRFVRECLLRVISDELWGSNHNKYRFLKNVKKLISLGKYDRFSLSELMWKMRVNDCTWLQLNNGQCSVSPSEHRLREEILSKFLLWLMGTYVVHLLKSFFYITETMFMKNMLFYYRKCVWNKIEKIGIRNHLAKAQLQPLSKEEWARKQRQKTAIPSYALRFIPKRNGLRPIVKMRNITGSKKCVKGSNARKIQYFDSQTKILFSALNYECRRNPGLVGSSVFGLDDIYKAWRQFVLLHLRTDKMRTPYYFVKADVTGAYDTIPHAKLVDVISRVLDPKVQENYCIRRYASIWSNSAGQIRKSFKRQVAFTMMDLMPNMKEFVSHLQQQTSLQNAVLVDQGLTLNENSGDLFSHFKQLIVENVIRIQDKYYVQRRGIPQGSILSTLLCSLCYGDMENQLFQGIQKDGLLLRLIDDFLLVTPHLSQAQRFLRMLTAGIPEYGCFIHPNKTMVNFPLDNDLLGCINVKTLQEHCLFPWCGLLLNTQTLEVYCDYSSYANTSITSSLTFNCSSKAGQNLRQKLLAVLKLKCHQIFLDLEVSTLRTVSINVYKIFLLQAYRFHACVMRFPFGQRVRDNPSFFLSVISDMASCCYSILKTKNEGIALGFQDASGPFPYEAAQWLCGHAFIVKLSSHRAIYKCLLRPLKTCKYSMSVKI
uniref:Telomerase reverse transcriptase n=1 Tax=Callorhinchus milii TaxID=7868 RepID=A0A4W3JXA5_CALMI